MWTKTLAIIMLFTMTWFALQAMNNTIATGQWLGLSESTTMGTYMFLHGALFALVASPILMLPLFLRGWLREIALALALSGVFYTGMGGYRLAKIDPVYQLEFEHYPVILEQRNSI